MDKKDAIKIITACAKKYRDNLANNNLLFVTLVNNNRFNYIMVKYLPSNFLHLTGFNVCNGLSPNQFYKKCLRRKLSFEDFEFKDDGTTLLKLEILPQLMDIHKCAKMLGDYNGSKPRLLCDKLAGTVAGCMALRMENNYFAPVSALQEDIRDLINNQERIIAIFRKPITNELFNNLTYLAKGFNSIDRFPINILNMVDINNLVCEPNVRLNQTASNLIAADRRT